MNITAQTAVDAALALLGRLRPGRDPWPAARTSAAAFHGPTRLWTWPGSPLAGVERKETVWRIGATTTLEAVAAASELDGGLRQAARRQAPRNSRQRATVGGTIACRDSGPLLAALLVLDARLSIEPGGLLVPLQAYLQGNERPGDLIIAVDLPAVRACALSEVSRSPDDAPILVVAVGAERVAGQLRRILAAGAGADQPVFLLAGAAQLLEGAPDADLAALAAVTPDLPWVSDGRGSAEYRAAMTPLLLQRAAGSLLAAEVNHAG